MVPTGSVLAMRDLFCILVNILSIVLIWIVSYLLIQGISWFLFDTSIPLGILGPITGIFIAFLLMWAVPRTIYNNNANDVEMAINALWPQYARVTYVDDNGDNQEAVVAKHIKFPQGVHFGLWWYKRQGPPVDTEIGTVIPFEIEATVGISNGASDSDKDTCRVSGKIVWKADVRLLDYFMARGKTRAERLKNIEDELLAEVKGTVESVLMPKGIVEIIGEREDISEEINRRFKGSGRRSDFEKRLGIQLERVKLEEVDMSEDRANAHSTRGTMDDQLEAAKALVAADPKGKLTLREALDMVRSVSGDADELILTQRNGGGAHPFVNIDADKQRGRGGQRKKAKKRGGGS